jgi:hypothetical protein
VALIRTSASPVVDALVSENSDTCSNRSIAAPATNSAATTKHNESGPSRRLVDFMDLCST